MGQDINSAIRDAVVVGGGAAGLSAALTLARARRSVTVVWAAGNATNLSAQVGTAAAEGTRTAQHINADLVTEDVERALERGGRSHQR